MENRPLVKFIRNCIRDSSGIVPISSLVRISIVVNKTRRLTEMFLKMHASWDIFLLVYFFDIWLSILSRWQMWLLFVSSTKFHLSFKGLRTLKIDYDSWCFSDDCWGPSIMRRVFSWCRSNSMASLTFLVLSSSNICSWLICTALSIIGNGQGNLFSGSQLHLLDCKVAFLLSRTELLRNISATMILNPLNNGPFTKV